ncbi:MAG: hypothetical protein AAF492_11335 [Verrucomicrobiota bacterium]
MESLEIVSRASIWLALVLYTAGEWMRSRSPETPKARWIWTGGCGFYVLHVLTAFSVFHDWSHQAATTHTALQTETLTGQAWGWGIYVNHIFTALWLSESLAWWLAPGRYLNRPRRITLWIRGFFLFMIFNGAVIFVAAERRSLGLLLFALLLWIWRPRRKI